jgi:hypothetical protein
MHTAQKGNYTNCNRAGSRGEHQGCHGDPIAGALGCIFDLSAYAVNMLQGTCIKVALLFDERIGDDVSYPPVVIGNAAAVGEISWRPVTIEFAP